MKTKRELNLENLIFILNEQQELEGLNDFNKIVKNLLDFFFERYEVNTGFFEREYPGAWIFLNDKYKEKWVNNIVKLTFTRLYPTVMDILSKEKRIEFNIGEFRILYEAITKNYSLIKQNSKIQENTKLLIKKFINYVYGASGNINFDTDTIFLKPLPDYILVNYIDPLNIPYEMEYNLSGTFIRPKKYALGNQTDISDFLNIKGFKIINF